MKYGQRTKIGFTCARWFKFRSCVNKINCEQAFACALGGHAIGMYLEKIKPSPKQAHIFMCLECISFENTVEKGEIAHK